MRTAGLSAVALDESLRTLHRHCKINCGEGTGLKLPIVSDQRASHLILLSVVDRRGRAKITQPIEVLVKRDGSRFTLLSRAAFPSRTSSGPDSIRRAADRSFAVQSFGFAVGLVGCFYAPLSALWYLSLVLQLPTNLWLLRQAWQGAVEHGKTNSSFASSVFIAATILGGYRLSYVCGAWFFALVRWLGVLTEDHSTKKIVDVMGTGSFKVWVLKRGIEIETDIGHVTIGDIVVVRTGELIPIDGKVLEGSGLVDQRSLTGEAQPAEKTPGEPVLAATVLIAGRLKIVAKRTGKDRVAARVGAMLSDVSKFKNELVSRADTFNDRLAPYFLLASGSLLPFIGLSSSLSLLIAMPGYRMIIYGPMTMLSYLRVCSKRGLLVKDGRALELLGSLKTVVFDKTGTLTDDRLTVQAIHASASHAHEEILEMAACAEIHQCHPVAKAIIDEAESRGLEIQEGEDCAYSFGLGIKVCRKGVTIWVGSVRYMNENDLAVPTQFAKLIEPHHNSDETFVLVAAGQEAVGMIILRPTVRSEAVDVIRNCQERGLKTVIISGDRQSPTQRLADHLGVDAWFADVLPEGKAELVKQLQTEGPVAFIGDGINDSIALRQADVSISIRGASTIATDTAQIILTDGNLRSLKDLFRLGKSFDASMRVNFAASAIPCVAIAGGALFFGWSLFTAVIICQLSLPVSIFTIVRPLLEENRRRVGDSQLCSSNTSAQRRLAFGTARVTKFRARNGRH